MTKEKVGNIVRIVAISTLFLGIVGYLSYYMIDLPESDPDTSCVGFELVMENNADEQFISKNDIVRILDKAHISPSGNMMKDINTKDIETFVSANPFVKEVNCYKSSTNKVIIKILQRTPIIYVMPKNGKNYFLDEEGTVIPNKRYVSNIVVASGDITTKYASGSLLPFARFINNNVFWNSQIEQIYVYQNQKQKTVVELVPRVGDQIIYLGPIEGYEKKLRRMKIFYDKAVGTVGWNKYRRFNLEYDNQIICTKHNK